MPAERMIGNYVLGPILGRGGMSEVHAAEHRFLGDRVAIKLLRSHLTGDPVAAEAFVAEAMRTRAIDHPGVVRILDVGCDGDAFYLVMERLDGESLAARLARHGRLGEAEVRRLGAAIADGVAAAHERGIVHRDLKPGNIMMVADQPKIIDFGIAREVAGAGVTGSRIGTIAYMAPEQLTGGLVAPCVDVWALGVVLYEALAGRLPFDGFADGRSPQLFEAPPRLGGLAPELEALITGCLERDPGRRPPSMRAIAAALREAAGEQRVTEELHPRAGRDADPARGPSASIAERAPDGGSRPRGHVTPDIAELSSDAAPDPTARPRGRIPQVAAELTSHTAPDPTDRPRGRTPPSGAQDSNSAAPNLTVRPRPRGRNLISAAVLAVLTLGIVWLVRARGGGDAERTSSSRQPTSAVPAPTTSEAPPATTAPPRSETPPAATSSSLPASAAPVAFTVVVRSAPSGAHVIVRGKRVGVTPATIALDAPASILVTRAGYRPSRVRAEHGGPIDVRLVPVTAARRPAAGETLD